MGVCTSSQGTIISHTTIRVQPYSERDHTISSSFAESPDNTGSPKSETARLQPAASSSRHSQQRQAQIKLHHKTSNLKRSLTVARLTPTESSSTKVRCIRCTALEGISVRKRSQQIAQCSQCSTVRENKIASTPTQLSNVERIFPLDTNRELPCNNNSSKLTPEMLGQEVASKLTSCDAELRDDLLKMWNETDQLSAIKSHARSASANDHLQLAEYLTKSSAKYVQNIDENQTHQILIAKAFALYFWICTNISYDNLLWNEYISGELHKSQPQLPEVAVEEVLSSRVAIGVGYASLFAEMAKIAGIKAEVVQGEISHVPVPALSADAARASAAVPHAWNMIEVCDVWFAIDCTLGAYYHDYRDTSEPFKPNFNRHFFLTTPSTFILTHWPKEIRWQLLQTPLSKKQLEPLVIFPSCAFGKGIHPLTWNRSIILDETQKSTTIKLIANPTQKIGTKLVYMEEDIGKCHEIQTNLNNLVLIQRDGDTVSIRAALPFKGTYSLLLFVNQEKKKTVPQVILSYHLTCLHDSDQEIGYPKVYETAAAAFDFQLVYWIQSPHDCVCESETEEMSLAFKMKRGTSCSHFLIPGKTRNTWPLDRLSHHNTMIVANTDSSKKPSKDQEPGVQMLKVVFPNEGWWTICLNGTKGNLHPETHGGYITLMSYHVFARKGNSVLTFPYVLSPLVSFCNFDPIPSIFESIEISFTTLKPMKFQAYIVEKRPNAHELLSFARVEETELVTLSPNQYELVAVFPKPGKWYVHVFGCEQVSPPQDDTHTGLFSLLVDVVKPMKGAVAVTLDAKLAKELQLSLLDKGYISFTDDGQPLTINFECGNSEIVFQHQISPDDPNIEPRLEEYKGLPILEHCTYLAPLHRSCKTPADQPNTHHSLLRRRSQSQPVLPSQSFKSVPVFRLHASFPWSGRWTVEFFAKSPAMDDFVLVFQITLDISKPSRGICYPIQHSELQQFGMSIPEQFISYNPVCRTAEFELPFDAPDDTQFAWNIEVATESSNDTGTYMQQGFVHQFGNRNPSHHFQLCFCTRGLWKAQLFAASNKSSQHDQSEPSYQPVLEMVFLVDAVDKDVSYPELFPAFKKYGLRIAKSHLPLISRLTDTSTTVTVPFFSAGNVKFWHRIEPVEGNKEECHMLTQMISNENSGLHELSVELTQPGAYRIMLWAQPAEREGREWDPVLRHTVECVCYRD